MAAKVHPELLEQLDQAGERPVQAIFHLHSPEESAANVPEDTTKLARSVLDRVAADVGHSPKRTNILRNLPTMIVEADPEFLRSLIQQPEIMSASPNQTAESPFIPPKGKRAV